MEAGMSGPLPLRPGVAAGGWLAVSGQVGLKDGALTDGVRTQTAQALANLRQVVESHGAGLTDVVKTNVFLVSMDDFAVMNEEYAKVFGAEPPARSAVAVHQLPLGALVEIEAWVHLPGH
jgi:2-iminobutanoate/2-iminopropanoate deaminase